jgi:nitronate monooxygenase
MMSASGRFVFADLTVPVIAAPMAGGPSTPQLAAAATNAGALGFVAAGYLTADDFAGRLAKARELTSGPLGANLFVPQPSVANQTDIDRYAQALAGEAQRYGAQLGDPRHDDDSWSAKLDIVLDLRPEVVSFTFDVPDTDAIRRLRDAGITTVATATTSAEAELAVSRGVDAVAVQGPAAGGHRGTYDPTVRPATQPLSQLLAEVKARVAVPVVAAGGLMTAEDVDGVLRAGAVAAQLGTAFLLADEAGSTPVHRAALQDSAFTETVVTRAFTGRYARGLRNRFIEDHEAQAPLGYPQIHHLTSPVRRASVRAGDPHATNVWAGTGFKKARAGSAATIVAELSGR